MADIKLPLDKASELRLSGGHKITTEIAQTLSWADLNKDLTLAALTRPILHTDRGSGFALALTAPSHR